MATDAVNQARVLMSAGQYAKAGALMVRHLQRNGRDIEAMACASDIFKAQGDYAKAIFYREKALALDPGNDTLVVMLAGVHQARNDMDKTHEVLSKGLEKLPNSLAIITSLVMFYMQFERVDMAMDMCERGLAIDPKFPQLRVAHAQLLHRTGLCQLASETLDEVLAVNDFGPASRIMHAIIQSYNPHATPQQVFDRHKLVGAALAQSAEFPALSWTRGDDPERRLRVAFISPDLRRHSVMYFAETLMDHLDRERFELIGLSTTGTEDDVTQRAKGKLKEFHVIAGLSPAYQARLCMDLKIDVAIDLVGLTKGNAAAMLQLRPAPVVVSCIGYPGTLGIANVGYRIVDSLTDPAGDPYRADDFAVEKLVRLNPCFLCYRPESEFLELEPASAEPAREGVTFGSFNHAQKISDKLMRTWARVMQRVPNSRLLVKGTYQDNPKARARFHQRFVDAGIDPARLTVLERTPDRLDHLRLYRQVDVALDTFPYHGTTTTCEALLMGVPVVTRAGQTHASRVGVSLLTNVGLRELIAHDEASYIELASSMAMDRARLTGLRGPGLRQRMLGSALCDGPAYGRRFGEALRNMWRSHCAGS
jgi:predicted O-linked N-acetylglucosamine transferase (SPINDLY family)